MKNVNKTPTLNKADGCSNLWHDYPYWHSVIQIKLSDIVHLPLNFNDDTKLMKRALIISIYRILLYHRCNQLRNIWYFRKFVHASFVIYQTIAAFYDWEMSNRPQMCFGKYCAVFNETKSNDIFYVRTVLFDIRRGRWNTNWDCKWKKMITFFNEISAKIVWV